MPEENTMQAIQISEFGGPEVCILTELPIPECGDDEVLVKIDITGVNYLDIYTREGIRGGDLPIVLGIEGAGTVTAIGKNVDHLEIGELVAFWRSVTGSYAEYAVVPAWLAHKVPSDISLEIATALHLQGMTAHYLAYDVFPLDSSHTCLIHAGAGGVGHLLIQIAKAKGARVLTTTGSKEKAEIAKKFGADEVILYRETDFSEAVLELTNGEGVDVVFDSVGQATIEGSIASAGLLGTVALFGDASGVTPPIETRLLAAKAVKLTRVAIMPFIPDQEAINKRCADLYQLHREGKLNPMIAPVRPLADAAKVQTELGSRETQGKLFLRASSD